MMPRSGMEANVIKLNQFAFAPPVDFVDIPLYEGDIRASLLEGGGLLTAARREQSRLP